MSTNIKKTICYRCGNKFKDEPDDVYKIEMWYVCRKCINEFGRWLQGAELKDARA